MREQPILPSSQPHETKYILEGKHSFDSVKEFLRLKGMRELNTNLYFSYPVTIHWFDGINTNAEVFIWNHNTYSFVSEREMLNGTK